MLAAAGLEEHDLPVANIWFGILALVILLVLLAVTLTIGKGRPDRK